MSPFTWGDAVRVVTSAPAEYRPSSAASVVGMRLDPRAENAVLVLVEFGDGSTVELPSTMLQTGA